MYEARIIRPEISKGPKKSKKKWKIIFSVELNFGQKAGKYQQVHDLFHYTRKNKELERKGGRRFISLYIVHSTGDISFKKKFVYFNFLRRE